MGRFRQAIERFRGAWTGFKILSSRYWYVYVGAAIVYEIVADRMFGWANAKLDETGIAILGYIGGEVVNSPMILIVVVLLALFVYAFLVPITQTRRFVEPVITILSEGVEWYWDAQLVGWARCPEHHLLLQLQHPNGVVGEMQHGGTQVIGAGEGQTRLYCPEPVPTGHTMVFDTSKTIVEARARVSPLFWRERHRRAAQQEQD